MNLSGYSLGIILIREGEEKVGQRIRVGAPLQTMLGNSEDHRRKLKSSFSKMAPRDVKQLELSYTATGNAK